MSWNAASRVPSHPVSCPVWKEAFCVETLNLFGSRWSFWEGRDSYPPFLPPLLEQFHPLFVRVCCHLLIIVRINVRNEITLTLNFFKFMHFHIWKRLPARAVLILLCLMFYLETKHLSDTHLEVEPCLLFSPPFGCLRGKACQDDLLWAVKEIQHQFVFCTSISRTFLMALSGQFKNMQTIVRFCGEEQKDC